MLGYGAYGTTITPKLNPDILSFVLEGGIFVLAHVRGGGNKGEAWYMGGYKQTKPNTWKDYISCAEFLINEKYTSAKKIAAYGASAGGILVGRAITERPDLFGAVIPLVGCLNSIRSENEPNGLNNTKEFGTIKDSLECAAIIEMDALYHLKSNTNYPAALITAGINDPRVSVSGPSKFAAKMQHCTVSGKPVLFSVDYSGGHMGSDSKEKEYKNLANIFAFALWQTGHPNFQVK
jgi:prolyl oligopeptidase